MSIYSKGIERGVEWGREQGEQNKAHHIAENLVKMGFSVEQIARAVGYNADMVRNWLQPDTVGDAKTPFRAI